jgi:hypothetical protein
MSLFMKRDRERPSVTSAGPLRALALLAALVLVLNFTASAQQPAPPPATPSQAQPAAPPAPQTPAPAPASAQPAPAPQPAPVPAPQTPPPAPAPPAAAQPNAPSVPEQGGVTDEEIKQLLVGKTLYLRGGYLDDNLSFNEHGVLVSHSPKGSYTLCGVEIDKVRLTKHKLELEGARYGLHFLGALPFEDPSTAADRVKITPKKKMLRITIDRESIVKPKQQKKEKKGKPAPAKPAPAPATPAVATPASTAAATPAPAAQPASATEEPEVSDADQAKAEIAAAPPEERPVDPASITTTTSPAHATGLLNDALDKIFAHGLDDRMMASMPGFWQLYYQAAADKTDYRPKDPSVLRQNTVDTKAKILSVSEPDSNEFAQANGVAGMALYHAVIGVDGKPGEIAVARPIGFGLDENAVDAIRKATFQPAIKDGKPVPVMLDLNIQFRIFSKRTAVAAKPEEPNKPPEPTLPGPYSVQHP